VEVRSSEGLGVTVFAERALYLGNKVGQRDLSLGVDNDRPGGKEWTKVLLLLQHREQTLSGPLVIKVAGMSSSSEKPSSCN